MEHAGLNISTWIGCAEANDLIRGYQNVGLINNGGIDVLPNFLLF